MPVLQVRLSFGKQLAHLFVRQRLDFVQQFRILGGKKPVDSVRQSGEGQGAGIHIVNRQLYSKRLLNSHQQQDRQQRVTAEIEEIVRRRDGSRVQEIGPDFR